MASSAGMTGFEELIFEAKGGVCVTEEVYTFAVDRIHCLVSLELGHTI